MTSRKPKPAPQIKDPDVCIKALGFSLTAKGKDVKFAIPWFVGLVVFQLLTVALIAVFAPTAIPPLLKAVGVLG